MDWITELEREAFELVEELTAHPMARRLFDGTIDAASYSHYLAQTYHYVRWTTPLLVEAGQRMKREGRSPRMAELLLQKSAEERGHERWLLADLAHLGWSTERVQAVEPCPAVTAYVAWNRYTTSTGTPTAFLGTAYVLEYLAARRASDAVERLLAVSAIPNIRKAVTFLRGHGSADGQHVAELISVLRSLLTDRDERSALLLSAHITRMLYTGFFARDTAESSVRTS